MTRTTLRLEALETRENPSTAAQFGDTLLILGTSGADHVVTSTNAQGAVWVGEYDTAGHLKELGRFTGVTKVGFSGLGGDDVFDHSSSFTKLEADGGAGNDTIYGGLGNDTIYGGGDNDTLSGGFGNDEIHGDNGRDTIIGGFGNDILWGDAGDDVLSDADFSSSVPSGGGSNFLMGGSGKDSLYGGNEADYLDGGKDGIADFLHGGGGADFFVEERSAPLYKRGGGVYLAVNLDAPADFTAGEDEVVARS